MATLAGSAPLPDKSALVEDPQFQEVLQRSRSLTEKILLSITDTHQSCIYTKSLLLNSSDNSDLDLMASRIGIPPAPVLKVSENFIYEDCLTQMSEGLQLHRALMNAVSPRLQNNDKVTALMDDIRDLTVQIRKMLRIVQTELVTQPSPIPVALHLTGEYDVQVAAHLILVNLQHFGQDMRCCFRRLEAANDEELDSEQIDAVPCI